MKLGPHDMAAIEHIYRATRHREQRIRQRDLAHVIGVSLGMTNAILRRLAMKGMLTVRKVNNRNIHYVVTARGIRQITRRSVAYVKRTVGNIVDYRGAIEEFAERVRHTGCTSIALVGKSELDFILEYACQKRRMEFVQVREETARPGRWYVYSGARLPRRAVRGPGVARTLLRSVLPSITADE